ncbi:hypothetical protein EJ04DRAFT_553289 [Polyplosphaeria fusca]|uniref:Uncharacterized protein n=1 Tax=Polyplosphaeria fusca TaxID=682080 RepID=A0A9P4QZ93_9PLEO|nr:hypothetical protein EJ04DRAFT_553289 [Polyplosphaeria fusca]
MNVAHATRLSDGSFDLLAREIQLYLHPETNDILHTWQNPFTRENVTVALRSLPRLASSSLRCCRVLHLHLRQRRAGTCGNKVKTFEDSDPLTRSVIETTLPNYKEAPKERTATGGGQTSWKFFTQPHVFQAYLNGTQFPIAQDEASENDMVWQRGKIKVPHAEALEKKDEPCNYTNLLILFIAEDSSTQPSPRPGTWMTDGLTNSLDLTLYATFHLLTGTTYRGGFACVVTPPVA